MRIPIYFVLTLLFWIASPVRAELKVIVLDNGETLLGEVLDTEEDEFAIRLQTGTLVRLPKSRIMGIEEREDTIVVKTTDIHLPRAIGEALHRAYVGELDYHYNEEEYSLDVSWKR